MGRAWVEKSAGDAGKGERKTSRAHRGPSHQMSIMNKRLYFAYLVSECLIENRRHFEYFSARSSFRGLGPR